MAVDVTLQNINSGYNTNVINTNFQAIKTALADALSRSGSTPNSMSADIDLNSNDLLNVNNLHTMKLYVDGDLVTPSDLVVTNFIALDGSNSPSADVSWGGNKLTNLADATADTDALNRQTADGRYLQIVNDLSDVTSVPTARSNINVDIGVSSKAAGYTVVASDINTLIRCTAAITLNLTAAATLSSDFIVHVKADGGDVTIDPNGAETIDGSATITINDGNSATIFCDGTNFFSVTGGGSGGGFFKGENGSVGDPTTGPGDIFRINEQTLNTDTTIAATENASCAGPLTVASGITLTITSGGRLAIL